MIPGTMNRSKARDRRNRRERRRDQSIWRGIPFSAYLLGGLAALTVLLLLSIGDAVTYLNLAPGQVATDTIAASVDFEAVDLGETDLARQRAVDEVLPIYLVDPARADNAVQAIHQLCDLIMVVQNQPTNAADEVREAATNAVASFLKNHQVEASLASILHLAPTNRLADFKSVAANAIQSACAVGIMESEETLRETSRSNLIALQTAPTEEPDPVAISRLFSIDKARQRIVSEVRLEVMEVDAAVLNQVIQPLITPNLNYVAERTRKARVQVAEKVPPVIRQIKKGEILVTAGATADDQLIATLEAHKQEMQRSGLQSSRLFKLLGNGSLLLMALFIVGGTILILRPGLMRLNRHIVLGGVLALIPVIVAKLLIVAVNYFPALHSSLIVYLIPIALAPLIATLIVDGRYALIVGFWTSLIVAIMVEQRFSIFLLGMVVTVVAILSVRGLQKRSNILRAGVMLGLAQSVFAIGACMLNQQHLGYILPQVACAFATGILVSLLALLIAPVLEWMFNMTSDVKLLELSDMGNPLLQRLAMEAPGTYHHSLMVANLSQSAAQAIGANSLLVRVAAYYHDIGKLTKPEFFIENNRLGDNPHDELSPSMSTLIIIAHVKEGVSLARRHKLPPAIIEAINTHHGTSVISYFHHRARELAEEDADQDPDDISEDDFRYPGPIPQSREMGILSLADSIEAASRSMQKPTAKNIESLVNNIVADRIMDGQLDDCELSMQEIAVVKANFIFTLTNMLHARVAYPKKDDEHRDLKSTDSGSGTRAGLSTTLEMVYENR